MTTATASTKQQFLDAFARLESQPVHPTIQRLRQAGIAAFDRLGFPGPRDEDWKFTSLAPVLRHEYAIPTAQDTWMQDAPQSEGPEHGGPELIAVNVVPPQMLRSSQPLPEGVIACSLAEAVTNHPQLVEPHLGRVADHRQHPIVAINTAFMNDGLFIYVPNGVVVTEPLWLSEWAMVRDRSAHIALHRRALIVVGDGAELTIVQAQIGFHGAPYLATGVTEVVVGQNASVDHYKVQQEDKQAFHLATLAVQQQRSSRFSTHYFGLGGALSRHEVRVRFEGEGCEATVNGLYQASGTQHFDNHTVIDHAKPHCNSHELYKGVLDGKARGVFTGKIFVRKDAQKTDAKQTNQTLLLSDDATINTKPQLEIFADDVKCTHGATVGQLDEQQLFYLRARGIDTAQARALLTFAFANDIIGRVKIPALRQRLEAGLLQAHHLPTTEEE